MNKSELAKQIAERMNISHSDSLRYLNTLVEEVETALAGNETLTIQNFGSFSPWHQTARTGRNPRNGAIHEIPERTSVKFKPGKRMLEKLNPTLRAIVCLLFLPFLTGCSDELQPASGEWIPVEINIAGIEQVEVSPMGTKAWDTELPSIVKSTFATGDEIKLTYTEDSNPQTVTLTLNNNGKWLKADGLPLYFPANASNTFPTIKAEYGTEIADNPGFSTSDYLTATASGSYDSDSDTKTYTYDFGTFKRPNDYSCIYIKIVYQNPPSGSNAPLAFTYAQFYTTFSPAGDGTLSPAFPITNDIINVFYKGTFTAYGVKLTPSRDDKWNVDSPTFNGHNNSYRLEFSPGYITPVQLIIPFKLP